MVLSYDEPARISDFLKWEEDNGYSREQVTIVTGQSDILAPGTVLGKITASGKYTPHVNGASDGTQTAVAIVVSPVDAKTADAPAVVVARDAIVSEQALIWDASVDDAAKRAAAKAQLEAVGILVREGA